MSMFKKIAKGAVVQALARAAPISWRWRKPGSLAVLNYHRVLPQGSFKSSRELPGMYVSPETLDLHLTELKRRFELVHLDDWLHRAKENAPLPKLGCAITFDDGWRDNYDYGLPVLVKHRAPATIFLVSSYIGGTQRFWPSRLITLLEKSFVKPGSVEFPERLRTLVEPVLEGARARGELHPEDVNRAVQSAKALDEADIRRLLDASDAHARGSVEAREILDSVEVARMAATGLVRFGSHTATHFRLGGHVPREQLDREIVDSRKALRELCGQEIDLFCYPNGDISPEAIDWVRRHYLGAVTIRRGWHTSQDDPYLVHRIGMHEDVSRTRESFLARISGWL